MLQTNGAVIRSVFLLITASTLRGEARAAPPELQDAIQAADPILWYSFNEPVGAVLNHGSLGPSHDAVVSGLPDRDAFVLGGEGGFGMGSGSSLESLGLSPLTGNPTFSIEAVVNLSGGGGSLWGPFLHWGSGSPSPSGREVYFGIQRNNNNVIFAGFYNAGQRTVSAVESGVWHHIVWTRLGGSSSDAGTTIYVDGHAVPDEIDDTLSPGQLPEGMIDVIASPFRVNSGADFIGSRFFTGTIDELALYDRVLDPGEIEERARLVACPVDQADPIGVLDFSDVFEFLVAFGAMSPTADLAPPAGVFDFSDVFAFLVLFGGGCP